MADPQTLHDGDIDPNVRIPKHVLEQGRQADAIHKEAYTAPAGAAEPSGDQPTVPAPSEATPPAAPAAEATPPQATAPAAEPPPAATPPAEPKHKPGPDDENDQTWKHRFLSMQGRNKVLTQQIGQLQEFNTQLASELQATQRLLENGNSRAQAASGNQPHSGQHHENLITERDVETYGEDLIDTIRRAAKEAVAPDLNEVRQRADSANSRVITVAQRELQATLTRSIPNWQTINRDPAFLQWLTLRNIYTGQVRREMLNAAYQAADAPKVAQMFRDFINEVKATGGTLPGSGAQQQGNEPPPQAGQEPAPRTPAMSMEAIAAPGRARPAPGNAPVPVDKPIYSHAQIRKNYDDKRKGLWRGRDADWNALEADMIAAGNEGRVRG